MDDESNLQKQEIRNSQKVLSRKSSHSASSLSRKNQEWRFPFIDEVSMSDDKLKVQKNI